MKKTLFLLTMALAFSAFAVPIPVSMGDKQLVFDTRGGGIKSIIWKKKSYTIPSGEGRLPRFRH